MLHKKYVYLILSIGLSTALDSQSTIWENKDKSHDQNNSKPNDKNTHKLEMAKKYMTSALEMYQDESCHQRKNLRIAMDNYFSNGKNLLAELSDTEKAVLEKDNPGIINTFISTADFFFSKDKKNLMDMYTKYETFLDQSWTRTTPFERAAKYHEFKKQAATLPKNAAPLVEFIEKKFEARLSYTDYIGYIGMYGWLFKDYEDKQFLSTNFSQATVMRLGMAATTASAIAYGAYRLSKYLYSKIKNYGGKLVTTEEKYKQSIK